MIWSGLEETSLPNCQGEGRQFESGRPLQLNPLVTGGFLLEIVVRDLSSGPCSGHTRSCFACASILNLDPEGPFPLVIAGFQRVGQERESMDHSEIVMVAGAFGSGTDV